MGFMKKISEMGGTKVNVSVFSKLSMILILFVTLSCMELAQAMCPIGCKCNDDILMVDCVSANLDFVPITLNPSVERLILKSNKIRSVDTGFSFYHQLTYIDLSHNHLLRIMPASFTLQTKLNHLKLNANKISHISNLTFGNQLYSLSILDLRENYLENIEPGIFIHTPSLEELDIGKNSIKVLNASSFQGLTNLRILKIDSNELSRVPDVFSRNTVVSGTGGSFVPTNYMPHLAELILEDNPLRKLNNDAFSALSNLVTLDLSNCKIATIEQYAFRGLDQLRKLVLTDNNLKAVPTISFTPLGQLENMKIGRNPIEQFGSNAFLGLRNLKNLEMKGAPELQYVDKDAFVSNLDLDNLEMSKGPKLALLPSRLLIQHHIKNLDLQDNVLTTLPEDLVNWQNLRSLRLGGNSFHCVCELFWLRDLFLEDKFKNSSTFVLCSEPKELRDQKLVTVSNKDLNCYLNGPVQKTILGISVALAVILLVVFFFLMYKYHDRIKNMCKRNRIARKNRSTVISSSGKERVDTTTKTSFLSQTQYPYSDEEFAIRASLMSASPPQSASFLHTHSMNPHAHNSLRSSLQRQHPLHHNNSFGGPPNYNTSYNDYETPHVNLNMNMNYPHYPHPALHSDDHNLQMHYPHSHQPIVKPIPITEL